MITLAELRLKLYDLLKKYKETGKLPEKVPADVPPSSLGKDVEIVSKVVTDKKFQIGAGLVVLVFILLITLIVILKRQPTPVNVPVAVPTVTVTQAPVPIKALPTPLVEISNELDLIRVDVKEVKKEDIRMMPQSFLFDLQLQK